MATISLYNDALPTPHAEVTFNSGEKVALTLERDGQLIKSVATKAILFRADPATVSEICSAMLNSRGPSDLTPLRVLTTLVAQMCSPVDVGKAFKAAVAAL